MINHDYSVCVNILNISPTSMTTCMLEFGSYSLTPAFACLTPGFDEIVIVSLTKFLVHLTLVCTKLEKKTVDFSVLFQVCGHSYTKRRRDKVPSSLSASFNAPEEKCCGPKSPGTS